MIAEDREHCVYRWYDATGRLLYIGCTVDLAGRMRVHRSKGSDWVPLAAHVEVESHPTRTAGYAAEKAAILEEQPIYNHHLRRVVKGVGDPMLVVVDRATGKVRFHTQYPHKVDWFLALVPHRQQFITFPDYGKYKSWRSAMQRRNALDRFGVWRGQAA